MRSAVVAVFLVLIPAQAQMVGQVGNNPGQSPSQARQADQKFEELRNQGLFRQADPNKELKIGAALVKESRFEEALPHLEAALALHPNDVTALTYAGFTERMLGSASRGLIKSDHYAKALAYYRRGLVLEPGNLLLHEYAGKVHLLLGNTPEAARELAELRRLCPSGCESLTALQAVIPAAPMN